MDKSNGFSVNKEIITHSMHRLKKCFNQLGLIRDNDQPKKWSLWMNRISGFGLSITHFTVISNLIYKCWLFSKIFEKYVFRINRQWNYRQTRWTKPFTLPKKEKCFRYKYPNHLSKRKGNPKFFKNQTLPPNCADFTVWGPLIEILFACC